MNHSLRVALLVALAVPASAQARQVQAPIVAIDLVKAKPGQRDRLIRFYQLNWEQRRVEALARGMITGYRLLVSADTGTRWDVMLETTYADSASYAARERNFGELIARNPAQPIDGMMRAALGDIVESRDLTHPRGSAAVVAHMADARINRYCHPPDECVLRGALLWDSTNVAPRYSEIMRAVGIQGEARAEFRVQPDGSVDPASIVVSRVTNRAFQQVVIDAIRTWKFRVATSDTPAVPVPTAIDMVFALADQCPSGLTRPITSLDTNERGARLIVMACRDTGPPRR